MKKTYKMLFALALVMLGANVYAADISADLDPEMFKAWDGWGANASVVAEPEECPNSDGSTSPFGCDYKLYETVSAGACVYGNTNVYYLWYADLTGTKTISFKGTPGLQLRILMNRPEPTEGGDPHGGQTVEQNVTLDDNGEASLDVSTMEYVHLNTIKLGWGSPEGIIREIKLFGSVKPVTGWVDMVNNGDMEGTDVSNFVVALDAVKDQSTYPATIYDGVGVDGSRGIMVESMDNPSESWQTQFFVKFNEMLPEGTQWRVSMDIRADQDAETGSGCHAAPRSWLAGPFFDPNPTFTTDWQTFTASGTLTASQVGSDGMGSFALDLNTLTSANKYYFDNIKFEVWREASPISLIKAAYGADVIQIDFGKATNMKTLVKANGGDRVVYDNSLATVFVNGQPTTLLSIEGRPDGYLWIFIDEGYPEGDGEDIVSVSFTNPTDADKQIIFTEGKYEGEPVPAFTNILADYNFDLSENYSYLYATPSIVAADPENGSFNLPVDLMDFNFTFDHAVDCDALSAKLDNEKLTINPASGFAKQIVLTRTGNGPLSEGVHTLYLGNVKGEKDLGDSDSYELNFSFGPLVIDPNDQPMDMIPDYFAEAQNNGIPEGYIVLFGEEERTSESTYGSGSRLFTFADGGDFTKALYFREGYTQYGSVEGHELTLQAGKKYNIHFNSAQWKDNGTKMTFKIMSADDPDTDLMNEEIAPAPNVNGNTAAAVNGSTSTDLSFVPEYDGNYLLRWVSDGFVEVLLANVSMKYVPNVLGVEETALVNTALENAKSVRDGNSDPRYDGAAFDALVAAINKYDGVTFTAPSACRAAAAELDAAAQFMKDHRQLCDAYDPLPAQAQTIIDDNAEKKFARTELYTELVTVTAKYAVATTEKQVDEETGEEYEVTIVNAKELKDDAELNAAVAELQDVIKVSKAMFTEGESTVGDWNPTCTGIAVLVERIRQGAEALKSLGVPANDPLIVAADNALTDDDALANDIKARIKKELYGQLKNASNTLFDITVDPETGIESEAPTYNMTVFVKNPYIYKLKESNSDYSQENVPGWVVIDGKGLTNGWTQVGTDKIPSDAMFSNWGGSFTVYQTVTDLPAGVYTLKAGYGERMTEDEAPEALDGTYFYVKTSDLVEDSLTCEAQRIGQSFPFKNLAIEEVVVTDGIVTLGVQAGAQSHVFFNDVAISMTAAATGVDYGKLYEEALAGIDETVAKAARIRAIELFDLNGRRVALSHKGVTIIKKYMSDGTVRVEKVVKK